MQTSDKVLQWCEDWLPGVLLVPAMMLGMLVCLVLGLILPGKLRRKWNII
jgi:hypothetical protein